jgi:hypothetical protein
MTHDVRTNLDLHGSLGLDGAVFGTPERVSWRTARAGAPLRLEPAALTAIGGRARLDTAARRLHVDLPPDQRWCAFTAPGREDALTLDPATPGTAVIAAEGRGAVSLALDTGAGLLVEFDPAGLTLTPVSNTAPWLADDNPAPPPLSAWARERGDEWLATRLDDLLRLPSLWNRTLALGLFVRLREPSLDPHRDDRLASAMRGEADPHDATAFRWTRCLRHDLVMALDDALAERCDTLERLLDVVAGRTGSDEEHAGDGRLADLCVLRDEVAAVLLILDRRAPRGRLRERLAVIDARGRVLAARLPASRLADDEHLRRAGLADALAWWVRTSG